MAGFFDFLDPIINAFGGGASDVGSSVPTSVEPDVLGSAAQTAQDTGGSLDAFGGIAPAAIGAANPAMFGGPSSFAPTGSPAPITPGDVATNPALGQMGNSGGPSSASTTQAQVGGITPTMTNAPSYAPPAPEPGTGVSGVQADVPGTLGPPPSVMAPGTEASRTPGQWWSTVGNGVGNAAQKTGNWFAQAGSNALNQVQKNPWQAAGVALPLAGSLAATMMQPGAPKPPTAQQGGFAAMPAPTAPSPAAFPPLSNATGASPLLQGATQNQGGFRVNGNPWTGLNRG